MEPLTDEAGRILPVFLRKLLEKYALWRVLVIYLLTTLTLFVCGFF